MSSHLPPTPSDAPWNHRSNPSYVLKFALPKIAVLYPRAARSTTPSDWLLYSAPSMCPDAAGCSVGGGTASELLTLWK